MKEDQLDRLKRQVGVLSLGGVVPGRSWVWVAAVLLNLSFSGAPVRCEKHALLVGAGSYANLSAAKQLEGPPNDVRALRAVLTSRWGFNDENVETLIDGEATRAAIVAGLDSLVRRSRAGDLVVVYYSGHGTSVHDPSLGRKLGLSPQTGALIPADFTWGRPEAMSSRMLIGSRDIRPRLEQMDRDRRVFAVFDACYSGASVRALWAVGQPKSLDLGDKGSFGRSVTRSFEAELDLFGEFGSQTVEESQYPYSNVVFVSAASRSEVAFDIPSIQLKSGRTKTVDGLPHGALTNALLLGLQGHADSDFNGTISYLELYEHVKAWTMSSFPQHPQLYEPAQGSFLSEPVFGVEKPLLERPERGAAGPLRLALEGQAADLGDDLSGIGGLKISDSGFDVRIVTQGDQYLLTDAAGDVISCRWRRRPEELVSDLRRLAVAFQLRHFQFQRRTFNAWLDLIDPNRQGAFRIGEKVGFTIYPEEPGYPLLLAIDPEGFVTVLFPASPEEALKLAGGRRFLLSNLGSVRAPTGTEFLKLFLFSERPEGYDGWLGQQFPADGPKMRQLLNWLNTFEGSAAEALLKVVTVGESGDSACE